MEIVKILDVTIGETGPTQNIDENFLKLDIPLRFHCSINNGDTILVQGRLSEAHDWDILHTFTDTTPADIYLSRQIRAIRSGGAGSSPDVGLVYVQNQYNSSIVLATHE